MKELKETIKQRQKKYIDISNYLKNDFKREKNLKEFKVDQRSKLYLFAKKVGKYLQRRGLNKFVAFVQENLNLDEYQYSYTIIDFLQFSDEKFISNAFIVILQREPTTKEIESYLYLLRSGKKSKVQIITSVRYSKEGKIHKLKISGIKKRYIVFTLYNIPILGYILKTLYTIVTLPKLIQRINYLENGLIQNLTKAQQVQIESLQKLEDKLASPNTPKYIEIESKDFYEEAIKSFTCSPSESTTNQDELYYSLFENAFYNHDVVLKKQAIYLKYIPAVNTDKFCHLDIGCGRGEFLTLLQKNDFYSFGIDINSLEIQKLKEQNFQVENVDMINFLKKTKKTFSSISALQVIEHIDYDTLKSFITLAYEKIEPSGVIILETINPHNKVAFNSFYMDETHKRPIPPEMIAFLLQFLGFKNVKYIYSSPMPEEFLSKTDNRINYHDYAVIGYKI